MRNKESKERRGEGEVSRRSDLLMNTLLMQPVKLVPSWSGIPPKNVLPSKDAAPPRPLLSSLTPSFDFSSMSSMYIRNLVLRNSLNFPL